MSVRDFPAPRTEAWTTMARNFLAAPHEGPPVRGAATVLLVRDDEHGPEVFVMRRVSSMEFAPSMYVFPGGGLDPEDAEAEVAGEALGRLAGRMGMPSAAARAFVACAIREVEEEVGVRVDPADLHVRANWVTPPFEPRRYDTWFFAARLPEGQVPEGATTEADHSHWVRPADLLAERESGTALMLPPTIVMLEELAASGDTTAYLAAEPPIAQVMPELVDVGDGYVMRATLP